MKAVGLSEFAFSSEQFSCFVITERHSKFYFGLLSVWGGGIGAYKVNFGVSIDSLQDAPRMLNMHPSHFVTRDLQRVKNERERERVPVCVRVCVYVDIQQLCESLLSLLQ